jgi:hypothetical protein
MYCCMTGPTLRVLQDLPHASNGVRLGTTALEYGHLGARHASTTCAGPDPVLKAAGPHGT